MKKVFILLCVLLSATSSALAGTIYFQDNFNTENGGVGTKNFESFDNWTVSDGTVDLIGNGYWDLQPGNGLYLDMDGSTNYAGKITTSFFLDAGDYFLDFDIAGNNRNYGIDFVTFQIELGPLVNFTVSADANAPFTSFSSLNPSASSFSVLTSDYYTLSFDGLGGDNVGLLLDNVKVESLNPVPEPATMFLFGTGLIGLASISFRRKKK